MGFGVAVIPRGFSSLVSLLLSGLCDVVTATIYHVMSREGNMIVEHGFGDTT
jgi:hypothetical protein